MIKSYKYRLYPNRKQVEALTKQLDGHRFLYNQALEERKEVYETTGKGISYFTQSMDLLPKLRNIDKRIAFCNRSSLQQTLRRLDKAFKSFFRRVKVGEEPGYPRFKATDRFNTINYLRLSNGCQIKEKRLYLQNVGNIKVKWHRPIIGKIKTLSITRRNDKWYVSFIVEYEPEFLPKTGKEIGIDMGLDSFITTNDGQKIEAPKFFRKSEKRLAKANRRLCRRKRGSKRRKKARRLVARRYERISNQRLDFCHKTAYRLVQSYDGFAVENLNIQGMVQNRYLAKSISDAGWGMFLNILRVKAENAGRWYEEIDPKGTSQLCSNCGATVKKSLKVRIHKCPLCGLRLDRDLNAARNILQKARTGPSSRGCTGDLVEARS